MTRRDRERTRLAIAQALLGSQRPLLLADSPLLEEAAVIHLAKERYQAGVLAEELALGDMVREAGERVLSRLGGDPRLARERAVLEAVLAGSSISSAAQTLGLSREHLSNTAWKTVTGWALVAFEEACAGARRKIPEERQGRPRVAVLS